MTVALIQNELHKLSRTVKGNPVFPACNDKAHRDSQRHHYNVEDEIGNRDEHTDTYLFFNAASTAVASSFESGSTGGSKRWITLPLRSTRNLVKFH